MMFPLRNARRSGFTLMELLVTIFILVAITVIALGVAAPDTQQRRLREAARQVELYLHRARSRAQELGRPVGVVVVPYRPAPSAPAAAYALQLFTAEVPEPYVAGSPTARIRVERVELSPPPGTPVYFVLRNTDTGWQGLVRVGDLVQLNHQGPWYRILGSQSDPGGTGFPGVDGQGFLQYEYWRVRLSWAGSSDVLGPVRQFPYRLGDQVEIRVMRFPRPQSQTFTAAEPLELPQGVVIDLPRSGIALPNGATINAVPGMFIGFSAAGQPFAIRNGQLLQGHVFLLVGLVERVADGTNLSEPGTYWVGVNGRTGQITTAINAGGNNPLQAMQYILQWDSEGGN